MSVEKLDEKLVDQVSSNFIQSKPKQLPMSVTFGVAGTLSYAPRKSRSQDRRGAQSELYVVTSNSRFFKTSLVLSTTIDRFLCKTFFRHDTKE